MGERQGSGDLLSVNPVYVQGLLFYRARIGSSLQDFQRRRLLGSRFTGNCCRVESDKVLCSIFFLPVYDYYLYRFKILQKERMSLIFRVSYPRATGKRWKGRGGRFYMV